MPTRTAHFATVQDEPRPEQLLFGAQPREVQGFKIPPRSDQSRARRPRTGIPLLLLVLAELRELSPGPRFRSA